MSEAERANTRAFLREVLQILPLLGLRAFEIPIPVVTSQGNLANAPAMPTAPGKEVLDTIIVPAQPDGFEETFMNCW